MVRSVPPALNRWCRCRTNFLGAFSEGELGDQNRGAFDGGRSRSSQSGSHRCRSRRRAGSRVHACVDVGPAECVALTFKEAGRKNWASPPLATPSPMVTQESPGRAKSTRERQQELAGTKVVSDEWGAGGQLQRGEVGVTGSTASCLSSSTGSRPEVEDLVGVQEDFFGVRSVDFSLGSPRTAAPNANLGHEWSSSFQLRLPANRSVLFTDLRLWRNRLPN